MRFDIMWFIVLAGLAIGFAGTNVMLTAVDQRPVPIDITSSLKAQTGWIATLGTGWGPIDMEGTPVIGPTASLDLPLPQPVRNDLVLEFHIGTASAILSPPATIAVSVNGQAVGNWKVAAPNEKRFLVPAKIASRQNPMRIDIATTAAAGAVIVQELVLKDATIFGEVAGHLDACANGRISGWAKSGSGPAPVVIWRNGVAAMSFVPALERPDLPRAGHPLNSGFDVMLAPPPAPGERIEVRFANGTPIIGVACR